MLFNSNNTPADKDKTRAVIRAAFGTLFSIPSVSEVSPK